MASNIVSVYTKEWDQLEIEGPSIFLAGPTSRTGCDVPSWRPVALKYLEALDYEGRVFIPECRSGGFADEELTQESYEAQVNWEERHLMAATVRLFWVERTSDWPAFTTNVEFGEFYDGRYGDVVYGRPNGAQKTRYLDVKWRRRHGDRQIHENLLDLCSEAIMITRRERL